MGRNKTPVVIMRKDKRIRHKLTHLFAFGLTGGASGIVTAAEAANHASYNARTRKLQREARAPDTAPPLSAADRDKANADLSPEAAFRRDHVPGSKEYRAAH